MLITSPSNKIIKEYKKLRQSKYRKQKQQYIIEGQHLVLEAFKAGFLDTLIITGGEYFSLDVNTITVSEAVMKYLSELETPTTVAGICHFRDPELISGNVVILDDIQDPGNLGTIIRSAVAFNINTIVLSPATVDLYNEKVLRAAQGMNNYINIITADTLDTIHSLQKRGYHLLATNVEHGKDLRMVEVSNPYALILGNEGNGVQPQFQDLSDDLLYIDINAKCESLNVAVAASIILYELGRGESWR